TALPPCARIVAPAWAASGLSAATMPLRLRTIDRPCDRSWACTGGTASRKKARSPIATPQTVRMLDIDISAIARMARETNARYRTSPARGRPRRLLCGRPTDVCGSLPEENRPRFLGDRGLRVDLSRPCICAHRGRPGLDLVEPALEVREIIQALLLLLVRHDPGIGGDVGDRVGPAGNIGAIREAMVQHTIQAVRLL